MGAEKPCFRSFLAQARSRPPFRACILRRNALDFVQSDSVSVGLGHPVFRDSPGLNALISTITIWRSWR